MTHEVWDYIFFKDCKAPKTKIPKAALEEMRKEFQFWYPLDFLPKKIFLRIAVWLCCSV